MEEIIVPAEMKSIPLSRIIAKAPAFFPKAPRQIPVPDQLMERITDLGKEAEDALMQILSDASAMEDVRMTAISLLSEMESHAPMSHYISWIASQKPKDEGADMAAEALIAMGGEVVAPILESVASATPAGKENFLDILCNFPGNDDILNLAIDMFKNDKTKRALYSSYLGKLGDPRALQVLQDMIDAPDLTYLDYIEIRNAVEELGGEVTKEREFAGDPYYETMRRMQ